MTRQCRHHPALRPMLLITLLFGFGLRVYRLGYQELRGDETFGYLFSLPSINQIVKRTFELQEPHPVASYFVQSAWLDWAGHNEYALRFPSAWFGLLSVALLILLAKELGFSSLQVGVSGLLIALSPYAIWHAQDARMYSMSLALTVASTYFFVAYTGWARGTSTLAEPPEDLRDLSRSAETTKRWNLNLALKPSGPAIGYIATALAALHTHYFAAFVILSHSLFLLFWMISQPRTRLPTFLRWIGIQLLLSLAYLPWLIPARNILTNYGGNGDSPGILAMLGRSLRTFALGETVTPPWIWLVMPLFVLGLLISLRANRIRTGFLLLALFVPVVITWLSALGRPIFNERYLIAAVPSFVLLLAFGISTGLGALGNQFNRRFKGSGIPTLDESTMPQDSPRPFTKWLGLESVAVAGFSIVLTTMLLAGIMLSLANHYTNASYSKTIGWRQLAQSLDRLSAGYDSTSARLVQNYPDPTLWYYYRGDIAHLVLPPRPQDEAGTFAELQQFDSAEVLQHVVIALQPADNWDNNGIAQRVLSTEFPLIAETMVESWPIQIYSRPPSQLEPVSEGAFVNGLVLSQASISPRKAAPGGVLAIHLGWRKSTSTTLQLTGTEKLFLHLIGPEETLIAQKDVALQNPTVADFSAKLSNQSGSVDSPTISTSYGILLPTDATEGDYRLLAGLYDPELDGAPRILVEGGGDSILLTEIRVEIYRPSQK